MLIFETVRVLAIPTSILVVVQISICSRMILRLSRTYHANIVGSSTPSVVASWIDPTYRVFWIPAPRCCCKDSIFWNRSWASCIAMEHQWTYVVLGPIHTLFFPCHVAPNLRHLSVSVCHSSVISWVPDLVCQVTPRELLVSPWFPCVLLHMNFIAPLHVLAMRYPLTW